MEESIFQIAEQIKQLHKKAYDIYLPLVDDVCRRKYRKWNYPICLIICWTLPVMKKCWSYIKRCSEGISILIRVSLSLILLHIGRC